MGGRLTGELSAATFATLSVSAMLGEQPVGAGRWSPSNRKDSVMYLIRERFFRLGEDSDITDEQGRLVLHVDGKVLSLRNRLVLRNPDGREVAQVQRKLVAMRPTYEISIAGQEAAEVRKRFFTPFGDRFTIDVPGPDDRGGRRRRPGRPTDPGQRPGPRPGRGPGAPGALTQPAASPSAGLTADRIRVHQVELAPAPRWVLAPFRPWRGCRGRAAAARPGPSGW